MFNCLGSKQNGIAAPYMESIIRLIDGIEFYTRHQHDFPALRFVAHDGSVQMLTCGMIAAQSPVPAAVERALVSLWLTG